KGAMLSGANLANAVVIAGAHFQATTEDRVLSYLPLCHVAEKLFSIHIPIATGASANFAESVDTVVPTLREVKPTVFLGVPRVWGPVGGTAPLSHDVLRFFHATGSHIREAWGMTENAAIGIITRPDDVVIGSVGTPTIQSEVRIAEDGEILFRSPCVFAGYYK